MEFNGILSLVLSKNNFSRTYRSYWTVFLYDFPDKD